METISAFSSMARPACDIDIFLQPLHVDISKIHSLARAFASTFRRLAAESLDQFLPTPISDSVLRPKGDEEGRYVRRFSLLTQKSRGFQQFELMTKWPACHHQNSLNVSHSRIDRHVVSPTNHSSSYTSLPHESSAHCLLYTTLFRRAMLASQTDTPVGFSRSICEFSPDFDSFNLTVGRGGTNLRVGFIELLGPSHPSLHDTASSNYEEPHLKSHVQRQLEKSWPVGELLKQNKAEDLFRWIGECVAEVVQDGCQAWPRLLSDPLPMGVTFSFPMAFVSFPQSSKQVLNNAVSTLYAMLR